MDANNKLQFRMGVTSRVSDFMYFEEPLFISDRCLLRHSTLGAFTYIGDDNAIRSSTIGRYCSLGPGVRLGPGQHAADGLTTSHIADPCEGDAAGAVLGHDVWVGANAIVMDGVHVGDGAIVGAGAVVTRDVTPYAVVGGVPARVISDRFAIDIVERLVALRWWRFDLPLWKATGRLPTTRPLDHGVLDAMERSIADDTAPFIAGRRHRITFSAGGKVLERLDEDEWPG